MSLTRAVSSSLSCHGCRHAIVRSFVSSAPKNQTVPFRHSITAHITSRPRRQSFTSTTTRKDDKDGVRKLEEAAELEASRARTEAEGVIAESDEPQIQYPITLDHPITEPRVEPSGNIDSSGTALSNVPWYLRTSIDAVAPPPVQIPDLPPNPPPLLETLLHYISMTAGLDDLLLLDLRNLDPPPALGPKLIMIIGTARSEKHLHVSADNFCRWLRREHHLRANAAGLLGRKELKIKLRRKAKRMKMLANVGGQEPEGNLDDGIRTGWICCTVGKIEAHPDDTHMPGDDVENFVGFREVKSGVNIVVQMFVEEKRAEIDLETLWGGVIKTHERAGKMADKILEDLDREDAEDEANERAEDAANERAEDAANERAEDEANERAEDLHPTPPNQKLGIAPNAVTSRPPSDLFPDGSSAQPPQLPIDPFPSIPSPATQWTRPKASAGDPFPPASESHFARPRHIRRLHTLGLRGS
ncbi:hypothetical protein K504DRAFT_463412 [Pleomassaria siparia CBS 279.74]|uniref:ATPase synthesis protein 25 n=1 Tax=Pleomassaria siparia CBS 279.74 TaxID=1314801 RepID=A0A6G1JT55_9PLEO|nr:hypothetical protein K504DRAFT_463412 [Pleomassaria siparia CBS 279.74]